MEYTVNKLALLAGVSARTLRYYDQIGLLAPARVSSSGYRIYGGAQVARLQQILFYRELGVELTQIARLLDDPAFDASSALEGHLAALRARRSQLDALITNAEATIKSIKGEKAMNDAQKFEGFKARMIQENEAGYGEEARQKYGARAVDASNAKLMNMSEEEFERMTATSEELGQALRLALEQGGDATGEAAQKAAELHREWLCFHWASYSPKAHKGLVDMCLADDRFKAYYDDISPGCATLLRDAVYLYCDAQGEEQP